jgi:hypothetical protein
MFTCCFCSETVRSDAPDALAMVVAAAKRINERDATSQTMWAHAGCLAERLGSGVVFDAEAFLD